MRIFLEPTPTFAFLNGVQTRVWTGQTDRGVKLFACIAAIGVDEGEDREAFERELVALNVIVLPHEPADEDDE